MGPKTPEQYFQNANEEKQFFQPSHQSRLQTKPYSHFGKKRQGLGEILVLYRSSCDNRRVGGQTRAVAVRVDGNVKCVCWRHGPSDAKPCEVDWPREWIEELFPSIVNQEESL